jgi:para-nitrobenzyl esterase
LPRPILTEEEQMTITATTTAGEIRGAETEGITVFKGVAYAAPPTGERRFRPPAPVEPWQGVRDALDFRDACTQPVTSGQHDGPASEDCLYLNVWTPALDGGSRPVMVWLHGGGFFVGSGNERMYNGEHLARRGDVVVVNVTHRLGALGYLHLGEILGDEFATSGNNGMLDIVQALEWVRDNIAGFGGDPGNVTIFGESGGGMKVSALHVMPRAVGLFHKAVIQSGPGNRMMTMSTAERVARNFLDTLGIPASQARTRLWEVPAEVMANTPVEGAGILGFSPVVDGVAVTSHPADALAAGQSPDVPLLIGSNGDESFVPKIGDDEEDLRTALARFGESNIDAIIQMYRKQSPELSNDALLRQAVTDGTVRHATIALAERKLAGTTTPMWMYLFTFEIGGRAGHGYEIPFVFDNIEAMFPTSASRQKLAAEMSDAWIAFTRTSDPSHPGLPAWPNYKAGDRATMTFNRGECTTLHDPSPDVREFWSSIEAPMF